MKRDGEWRGRELNECRYLNKVDWLVSWSADKAKSKTQQIRGRGRTERNDVRHVLNVACSDAEARRSKQQAAESVACHTELPIHH